MRMVCTNVRENGRKRNIFSKVAEIEKRIGDQLPEMLNDRNELDKPKLIAMLSHCRRFYEGKLYYGRQSMKKNHRQRDLTPTERIVYDVLIRYDYNPSTTYRWFLATRIPQDIQEKMMQERMSVKLALVISANRKKTKECKLGLLLLEDVRDAIRRL